MTGLEAPIGVFDSGVGGLTVARAIADQLPHERMHYVGDTAHGPYGPLPIAQIRSHAPRADCSRPCPPGAGAGWPSRSRR